MTNTSPPLKTGDAVIPLAGLATQCGAVSGSVSVSLLLYRLNSSWVLIITAFLAGVLAGGFVGWVVGRLFFPASSGQVFVVRAGKAALTLTLRAAMVSALFAGVGLSIFTALMLGGLVWSAAVSGVVIAVAVGLLFGLISALV